MFIVPLILLTACTITVAPLPTPRKTVVHHHVVNHTNSQVKVTKTKGTMVDAQWVQQYRKLEAQSHHVIPQDSWINATPTGRFWVPQSVIDHYSDLVNATPAPSPTETPKP